MRHAHRHSHSHSECLCRWQKKRNQMHSSIHLRTEWRSAVKKRQQQFLLFRSELCISSRWKYAGSRCALSAHLAERERIDKTLYCHLNFEFGVRDICETTTISFLLSILHIFSSDFPFGRECVRTVFHFVHSIYYHIWPKGSNCAYFYKMNLSHVHLLLFLQVYLYFKFIYVQTDGNKK